MPTAYTWEADNRFWAGQAGNFYSPNPGDEATGGSGQRNRSWNWPRMPWQRNIETPSQNMHQTQAPPNQRFISSSDSQYGFTNGSNPDGGSQQNGYSVIAPYGVHWGPPPPYISNPNSPARRYQYIHANTCHQNIIEQHIPQQSTQIHHEHNSSSATDTEQIQNVSQLQQQHQQRNAIKRVTQFKSKENYENTPSDSDGPPRVNTLPTRKQKKQHIGTNKSIGNNNPPRANVQNVFNNQQADSNNLSENEYNEPSHPKTEPSSINVTPLHHAINVIDINNRRLKLGIENTGFQPIESVEQTPLQQNLEIGESEVYFADVSSCCNIYEDANQRSRVIVKNDKMEADEYLSQRFGNREASTTTRSRLPFPLGNNNNCAVVPAPRTSLIQKEISRQSMCSIDSSEKTDFTDLSPATPTTVTCNDKNDNFVASFPSYNEQSSQEAHRRSTKNLQDILSASPYETIKEDMNLNSYELNHDISSSSISSNSYNKSSHSATPTKSTPIKRSNLGTNISAIIQNLSGNDIGLLYPENNNASLSSPHHQHKQKQDCNNDVINRNIVINSEKEWQSELNGNDRRREI